MLHQQESDLLHSVVDQEISDRAYLVTVLVAHLTATDIVDGAVDRLTAVAQCVKGGVLVVMTSSPGIGVTARWRRGNELAQRGRDVDVDHRHGPGHGDAR